MDCVGGFDVESRNTECDLIFLLDVLSRGLVIRSGNGGGDGSIVAVVSNRSSAYDTRASGFLRHERRWAADTGLTVVACGAGLGIGGLFFVSTTFEDCSTPFM